MGICRKIPWASKSTAFSVQQCFYKPVFVSFQIINRCSSVACTHQGNLSCSNTCRILFKLMKTRTLTTHHWSTLSTIFPHHHSHNQHQNFIQDHFSEDAVLPKYRFHLNNSQAHGKNLSSRFSMVIHDETSHLVSLVDIWRKHSCCCDITKKWEDVTWAFSHDGLCMILNPYPNQEGPHRQPYWLAHDYRPYGAYSAAAYQYAYPQSHSSSSSAPIFNCGTSIWKLCLSVLLTTVAIEIVFVLFTGLHLYHGVMYQNQDEILPGLGGGWDPETNTTLYPPGPIHINPFRTTTPPTEAEKSVEQFLKDWQAFCLKKVVTIPKGSEGIPLCPCIPRHLSKCNISFIFFYFKRVFIVSFFRLGSDILLSW